MQCIAVPACVSEFYDDTCNEVKGHSWYKELQKILCRVASTFSTCLFIVDALDEVEPRFNMPGLLNLLALLRNGMKGRAPKIFATSRKHASLVLEAFPDATKLFVSANNDDLRTILAKIILDHRESKYILDENLKRDILDKLCTNAHGMYVFLFSMVEKLTACSSLN